MKWLLIIFFLAEHEHGRIPFATEEACMDAAQDFAELNPNFEWLDDPSGSMGWAVIRSTVECIGADENQMPFERRRSQRGDP